MINTVLNTLVHGKCEVITDRELITFNIHSILYDTQNCGQLV